MDRELEHKELYTTKEVADYLKIHFKTVLKMINNRELKAHKIAGQWRVTPEDLSIFVRTSKRNE